MANKNLIIGGFTNYGINQLKPWVLSAKEVAGDNEVVLVTGNATDETVDWLRDQGVVVVPMLQVQNVPIHVLRFLSIYDYLHKYWQEYDYVVTTDVKDVYFQYDPFQIFNTPFFKDNHKLKLIVASEGLKYKDEAWGNENLMQAYGPYVYEQFKDNEIFNVGTFGGYSEHVKDMVFNIFTNAINRPIPICDQAVFNVLINTQPFKEVTWYTHDWAAELGTVMDPSKIEGFRPNLLFSEPIWKDKQVMIPPMAMRPFPIVHQYDRVPFLKKFVQEKYGQEDDSQMFVYRTT
jgi:hypothetical protein